MRRSSRFGRGAESQQLASLLVGLLLLVAACDDSPTAPEGPMFRITDGACGQVVFVEKLGADLAAALHVLEGRKADQFGAGQVTLDTYRLAVVDGAGHAPQGEFYAVRVVDNATQLLAHSVAEVVTSTGDLFRLEWCPD